MKIDSSTIALVTGASRGLGYATALALAEQGSHVIALARTVGGLEELADAIDKTDGSVTIVPLDITDEQGLQRMCRSIHDRWGRLDLMIHCAVHATLLAPAPHISDKDFARMLAVNTHATQRVIANCGPLLSAAEQGTAVFFDDQVSGNKFFAGYGATKAGAKAIIESWQNETAQTGPRVILHTPDPMPTSLRARFYPGENRDCLAKTSDEAKKVLRII